MKFSIEKRETDQGPVYEARFERTAWDLVDTHFTRVDKGCLDAPIESAADAAQNVEIIARAIARGAVPAEKPHE